MQLVEQVFFDRPPLSVQCSKSVAADPVSVYSASPEETGTKRSRKLLPRKTDPYAVRFATEITVTTDKVEIAVPVSLDWVVDAIFEMIMRRQNLG